jgi:hypothetical protein
MRKRVANGLEEASAVTGNAAYAVLALWFFGIAPTWQLAAWLGGICVVCALLRVFTAADETRVGP